MKFKRSIPYQILIEPTPNGGFIVTVGCVKVAYSDPTALLRDMTAYLQNPEDVEKQYNLDIGKLGRVHIGNHGSPLASGVMRWTESAQEQMEREVKANPQVTVNPGKEYAP